MVLAVNSLGNIRDKVEMMLDLGFSLLKLVTVFTSLHAFFLDLFFCASDF